MKRSKNGSKNGSKKKQIKEIKRIYCYEFFRFIISTLCLDKEEEFYCMLVTNNEFDMYLQKVKNVDTSQFEKGEAWVEGFVYASSIYTKKYQSKFFVWFRDVYWDSLKPDFVLDQRAARSMMLDLNRIAMKHEEALESFLERNPQKEK